MRLMALLLLLTAALSLLGLTPFSAFEISRLIPTELLAVSATEDGISLRTEDGYAAWGRDLPRALENLRAAAPGTLLLSTVEQVVLTGVEAPAEALVAGGLRPGTAICTAPWVEDPGQLAKYLGAREGSVTLGKLLEDPATALPALVQGETGLYFPKEESS